MAPVVSEDRWRWAPNYCLFLYFLVFSFSFFLFVFVTFVCDWEAYLAEDPMGPQCAPHMRTMAKCCHFVPQTDTTYVPLVFNPTMCDPHAMSAPARTENTDPANRSKLKFVPLSS